MLVSHIGRCHHGAVRQSALADQSMNLARQLSASRRLSGHDFRQSVATTAFELGTAARYFHYVNKWPLRVHHRGTTRLGAVTTQIDACVWQLLWARSGQAIDSSNAGVRQFEWQKKWGTEVPQSKRVKP